MDKKHEMYNAPLKENVPDCFTKHSLKCLADCGISTLGQLMDRWEVLSLVSKSRGEFKAMLRGLGVKGRNVDDVANFCATMEYRLQTDKEARVLYRKIGGKYVPAEALSDRVEMPEGIYLVRTSGRKGGVCRIHSLQALANEVGWFRIAGKPVLDFEPIAKIDYYTEAIVDFVLKRKISDMSLMELAQRLAKIMLEVTENARAGNIPTENNTSIVWNKDVQDNPVK